MSLDTTLYNKLAQYNTTLFFAVEIFHPFKTIRLVDGGFVYIDGNKYVSNDPDVGSLKSLDVDQDGIGDQAPGATIVIAQASSSAAISLCTPDAQGSQISCYFGAIDPATGLIVGTPYTWFIGEIDVPNTAFAAQQAGVVFDCVGGAERFFDVDEGMRMTNAFLQLCTPGDLGFQYLTDVELNIPWGSTDARPALSKATL